MNALSTRWDRRWLLARDRRGLNFTGFPKSLVWTSKQLSVLRPDDRFESLGKYELPLRVKRDSLTMSARRPLFP